MKNVPYIKEYNNLGEVKKPIPERDPGSYQCIVDHFFEI
jgi:hypothetical protein